MFAPEVFWRSLVQNADYYRRELDQLRKRAEDYEETLARTLTYFVSTAPDAGKAKVVEILRKKHERVMWG